MRRVLLTAAVIAGLGAACFRSHERPLSGGSGTDAGAPDARMDASAGDLDAAPLPYDAGCDGDGASDPPPPLTVDLLWVIDDSVSMGEEQATLVERFPSMVRMLATGDVDGDGRADLEPVADLQVGVVTTTVRTAPDAMPAGCTAEPRYGDDGALRREGFGEEVTAECEEAFPLPPFLSFAPGAEDPVEPFIEDFRCLATVGTHGCGFEQPLEAVLKAILPSDSRVDFAHGTGRGDLNNAGFAREDSVLAVVIVTDEDDCSVRDPALLDYDSDRYPPPDGGIPTQLRCVRYPEGLYPIARYERLLNDLRPHSSAPELVAAITGVPPDLVDDREAIDYDDLLADERMQVRLDSESPGGVAPACSVEGRGSATPARRIVRAVRTLGEHGTVQSICDHSFDDALRGITSRLGRVVRDRRCK